jgi:hypothetical protein
MGLVAAFTQADGVHGSSGAWEAWTQILWTVPSHREDWRRGL